MEMGAIPDDMLKPDMTQQEDIEKSTTDFSYYTIIDVDFSYQDLSDCSFKGATLINVNLSGANLNNNEM